ncbi:MAG: hypothetical protein M0Z77_06270 [Thermoplasmatales archaeon]|nr:hypothetical protein [Thermoplasmatales archaeon]
MRSLAIALVLATIMVLSSMALATAAGGNSKMGFDTSDSSSNGISNFMVRVNNQEIEVFRYFNITGASQSQNLPNINENKIMPLFWQGFGNVSITPTLSFSAVGNVNYYSSPMEFVFFYQFNYLGILLATGRITESGNQISITGANSFMAVSVAYLNAPLSDYNFSQNSFKFNGGSYYGNYSSFYYSAKQIDDYSLINQESSVSVISSISNSNGMGLSFDTAGISVPGSTGIFVSDNLFPLIYLDGFNSSTNITLSTGFHFGTSEDHSGQGDRGGGNGPGQDPFDSGSFPIPQEHVYKIMNGFRTVGYVDAYGQVKVNNTSLVVNAPLSFVLVRFLPSFQSTNGTNHSNDDLQNATTEIYVDNQAYFVPFSPNITSQNLSFGQNLLNFVFTQNGTQQFVIVIQGNFSVSTFSLTGTGQNNSHYKVTRTSNQTIISFLTNGSGQRSLSLSIAPYVGKINQLPLIGLLLSSTILVIVVGTLILYSRRKSLRELEKE